MGKGILYLVPTPIGNLGDMTFRAVEVLQSVDLIACEDTRTSQILLHHYNINNKTISYHKFNEKKQTVRLLELLQEGKSIAVITDAGTPGISDPAAILVKAAIEKDIAVSCLPGATALVPALAASGLDTEQFTFAGFLPAKAKERIALLESLSALPHSIVLYESSHRIIDTLTLLQEFFQDRQCVLAKELSKIHETFIRGTLEEIIISDFDTRGEFVILIEGKPKEDLSDTELLKLIRQESKTGSSLKETAATLSHRTGVNKNRIYKLALTNKEKS